MKAVKKLTAFLLPLAILICTAVSFGTNAVANDGGMDFSGGAVSISANENIVSHYYLKTASYETNGGTCYRYSYNCGKSQEKSTVTSGIIAFPEDGEIQIDVEQAAAQISEPVTVEILDSNQSVVSTLTYTAKEYCDSVIDMTPGELAQITTHGAQLQALCKSIVAYAKSAQGVFGDYMAKAGSVAITDDYSSDLGFDSAAYSSQTYTKTDSEYVRFSTASFLCESSAKMRFYIAVSGGKDISAYDEATVSAPAGTTWIKGADGNGRQFFQINDIKPVDFDEPIEINFAGASITMSVLDYAGKVAESASTSAQQKTLAKALIRYNEKADEYFSLPATQYVPAKAATCTESGWQAHYTYQGNCYEDADATTPVDPTVPALGHDYAAVVTQPTCSQQGYTTYTCTRCGDSYAGDYTDTTPHTTAWVVTSGATATDTGTETETCSVCGAAVATRTVSAFTYRLPNTAKYLYRVGNANAVKLGTLFANASGADITDVTATVTRKAGDAGGTFTANAADWRESTVKFTGTGVVTLTLKHGAFTAATLNLEVVTATNFVEGATLSSTNIVLLGSAKLPASSGTRVVSLDLTNKSLYGNGFTVDASGSNISTKFHGLIRLKNSFVDNAVIVGPTFTTYQGNMDEDYYASTIWVFEGSSTVISNCRITGAASPLRVMGDVTVKDTVLSGGFYSNLELRSGNLNLDNVTTVNTQNSLGIVVDKDTMAAKITIDGYLTQHNFITSNTDLGNTSANTLRSKMFDSAYSKYQFTSGGTKYVNTGIISMSSSVGADCIIDNRTDKKNYEGQTATFGSLGSGYVYTMTNADYSLLETEYTEPAYTPVQQKPVEPAFTWAVPSGDYVAAGGDSHCYKDSSGVLQIQFTTGNSKTLNVASMPTVKKYDRTLPTSVTCTNKNGNAVAVTNGNITFTEAGEYTLTYTYTDNYIFNENGAVSSNTVTYSKNVTVNVAVKKEAPNAKITVTSNTGTMIWGSAGSAFDRDYQPAAQIFDNMTIVDYDDDGNEYTVLDGSNQSAFMSSISSVVADSDGKTGFTINFPDGTKLAVKCGAPYNSGTLQFKQYNSKFLMCGSTAYNNATAATWYVNSYTYTGRNGAPVSYTTRRGFTSTTDTTNYSLSNLPTNNFVIFDAQGGTVSPAYTTCSSSVTLPTPVREGFGFKNWNTKADGTGTAREAGQTYSITSATTLYAIWTKPVTVTYDTCDGNAATTINQYSGLSETLPSPTYTKHYFLGWYTDETGGTKVGDAGGTYTVPESDVTYYAHWAEIYTVTYDPNYEGATVDPASQNYITTALTPPTPVNGTQTFLGWYDEPTGGTKVCEIGATYTPISDITLYAHWRNTYKVTYNANGGQASTDEDEYYPDTATPVTLPSAVWAGHQFDGWYDAQSGGNRVGSAQDTYTPNAPITLYAHWTAFTVTYNANGGTVSPASASGAVTLPTPSRTGYTFNGWYDAESGGNKVGDAGTAYTPTADITLYARWTINSYTLTITESSSSTVVTVDGNAISSGASIEYNKVVKVELSYTYSNSLTFTIKQGSTNVTYYSDSACTSVSQSTTAGTYYFKMPAGNTTINSSSSEDSSCVTADTLITLADGTQKRIDELTGDEELLVWNLETGAYDSAPIVFIDDTDEEKEYNVIHLYFSDGTETKMIYEHGYFDIDLGEYVYITDANYRQYIGDTFIKQADLSGNTWQEVTLTDAELVREVAKPYSANTADHICFFVDGMLSMPGGIKGMFNIFEVDTATMTYDLDAMQRDIETYGLYTYEDFEGIISEETFDAFNCAYLKVAVGKGMVTWDDLCKLAQKYNPLL